MCGILATIGESYAADFDAALDALATRGPDDRGVWTAADVRLGHRRLAVIDLTDAGHQPMSTADGRYTLVFNGEIYNFPDLRDELAAAGVSFRGHSDTEVLLHALAVWGAQETLPRLDGMFAFAFWDAAEQTITAARDRFGIKPLYYSEHGGFAIASTLAPFWKFRNFPKNVSYPALRDYLCAQSVFVPDSILRAARGLEQGCWIRWSRPTRKLEHHRYFDIEGPGPTDMSFEDLVDAADAAIDESVRRQMVADVPLGAFLSGGIDSSLLVHYMAKHSGRPVKTFSVSFPGLGDYDESRYAKMAAEQFATEHHELQAHERTVEDFQHVAATFDQPLADSAFLPTIAISELAREHVTVAISGDGGDELFGGYPRYLHTQDTWPDKPKYKLRRKLLAMGLLPGSYTRRTLRGQDRVFWARVRMGPWRGSRKDYHPALKPEVHAACEPDQALHRWKHLMLRYNGTMDCDPMMRADLWTYLSDNCLVKTDRASMAHSLEVRVPLLGNPVADLILPHHAEMKMHGGQLKAVLKALAARHVDRRVWDRPKHGFSTPTRRYFTTSWRRASEQLVEECEKYVPFFDRRGIRQRWNKVKRGRGDDLALYTWLLFIEWAKTHPIEP